MNCNLMITNESKVAVKKRSALCEKYTRYATFLINLLSYLQPTNYANVLNAVDIIICYQGFPDTYKLFQGFLHGKKKG